MAGSIDSRSVKGKKIDLNSASKDELKEVKGISDTLAEKIVEYRDAHGGFKSMDDLENVEGFSNTRKDELRDAVELGSKKQ